LQSRALRVDIMALPLLRLLAHQTGRRMRGRKRRIGGPEHSARSLCMNLTGDAQRISDRCNSPLCTSTLHFVGQSEAYGGRP
jgi:hypothetical protein